MSKVEDLLKPRWRCIADWPGVAGKVRVGDIFKPDPEDEGMFWIDGEPFQENKLRDYPHLFRPLAWYEERQIEQMPEYVKVNSENTCLFLGNILKVRMWKAHAGSGFYCWLEEDKAKSFPDLFRYEPDHFIPATEKEYLEYINKQQ